MVPKPTISCRLKGTDTHRMKTRVERSNKKYVASLQPPLRNVSRLRNGGDNSQQCKEGAKLCESLPTQSSKHHDTQAPSTHVNRNNRYPRTPSNIVEDVQSSPKTVRPQPRVYPKKPLNYPHPHNRRRNFGMKPPQIEDYFIS